MTMSAEMEKALVEIVKNFLLHETKAETVNEVVVDNSPVDHNLETDHEEFVKNLYHCLAERGILRELHAFLRQRLVEILKGAYPNLVTVNNEHFNWTIVRLFEDFLCCHKLLFTFSVLVTEMGNCDYTFRRDDFGKLTCKDAENLLDDLSIRKDSEQSRKILTLYSEKENSSLLECILEVSSSWPQQQQQQQQNVGISAGDWQFLFPNGPQDKIFTSVFDDPLKNISRDISDKLKQVDYEFAERLYPGGRENSTGDGADGRFLQMQLVMEKDKQLQIKNATQKFREEEIVKIRDEIETRLKFEMISKEKELLRNYEDRVSHMKNLLDREKDIWAAERSRKEKELFTQRQDLIKLIEHVKEKKVKLKEALEKIEHGRETISQPNVDRNLADSSIGSEETSSDRDQRTHLKYYNLQSTISRLPEENLRLQKKMSKQSRSEQLSKYERRPRDHSSFDSPPNDDSSSKSIRSGINEDKIALLQYTVEKQTDELEKLKKQLKVVSDIPSVSPDKKLLQQQRSENSPRDCHKTYNNNLQCNNDQDLETFLKESKRRFAEIEKKAELVGSSLRDVFKRHNSVGDSLTKNNKSLTSTMSTAKPTTVIPPSVPKLPPSLQKSSHPPTKSILAPRFISIDQALKSFLLNQSEDSFNSNVPIIPESSHLKYLHATTNVSQQQPLSTPPPLNSAPQTKAPLVQIVNQKPISTTTATTTTILNSIPAPSVSFLEPVPQPLLTTKIPIPESQKEATFVEQVSTTSRNTTPQTSTSLTESVHQPLSTTKIPSPLPEQQMSATFVETTEQKPLSNSVVVVDEEDDFMTEEDFWVL